MTLYRLWMWWEGLGFVARLLLAFAALYLTVLDGQR